MDKEITTQALISVVLPVYNGAKFIANAIESILDQTYENFELIVINDGSKDNTLEILNSYAVKDDRIKIVSRQNKGLIETLNEGFSLAKGKYIARQDDDDISHPQRFEKQIAFMEKNEDYALCGTFYNVVTEDGEFIRKHFLPSSNENIQKYLFDSCFGHGSVMIRKEMIQDMVWYNKDSLHVEDYDFFIRIAKKHKVYNIPEYLYDWCFRGESVSFENYKEQRTNKRAIQIMYDKSLSFQDAKEKALQSYTISEYNENLATVYLLENKKIKALNHYMKSLMENFRIKSFLKLIVAIISRRLWIKSMEVMRYNKYKEQ